MEKREPIFKLLGLMTKAIMLSIALTVLMAVWKFSRWIRTLSFRLF